jgi:hypothetical protein
MSTIPQIPTVDPQTGDIQLHGRQGVYLPLSFADASTGDPRDVTGLPIFFEVDGAFRVELEAGETFDERVVVLSQEQVGEIFGGAHKFALVDESASVPDTPWAGWISTYGYKDQPA